MQGLCSGFTDHRKCPWLLFSALGSQFLLFEVLQIQLPIQSIIQPIMMSERSVGAKAGNTSWTDIQSTTEQIWMLV